MPLFQKFWYTLLALAALVLCYSLIYVFNGFRDEDESAKLAAAITENYRPAYLKGKSLYIRHGREDFDGAMTCSTDITLYDKRVFSERVIQFGPDMELSVSVRTGTNNSENFIRKVRSALLHSQSACEFNDLAMHITKDLRFPLYAGQSKALFTYGKMSSYVSFDNNGFVSDVAININSLNNAPVEHLLSDFLDYAKRTSKNQQ